MTHHDATDELVEQAALYALGALAERDAARFEAHLRDGCEVCEQEVRAFAGTVEQLALEAEAVEPPPEVRARLLARVAEPRPVMLRSRDLTWEAGRIDGMELARLFTEPGGRTTAVVRLAAGAAYPARRDGDTEELYVLSGELAVDDEILGTGDYCAGLPGTVRPRIHARSASTFLFVRSENDEIVSRSGDAQRSGLTVVRAGATPWRPTGIPGLTSRRLLGDPLRQTATELVRMAPRSSLPRHRHVAVEQFYMIDGDARVDGHDLAAGDFYRMEAGTTHEVSDTEHGCTLLLISSRMEMVA